MADGQWPGRNGQQEWPDDGRSLPPWRSAQHGDTRRLGPYGQPSYDERGSQGGGDGRWQPPEWRYGQQRHGQENQQRRYAPGQYQPQPGFQTAPPPQHSQWGYGPPSPQPPYEPPYRAPQPPQPPRRGKSWPARHKALTGIFALVALIIVIAVANSGGSSPGGGTTAGLTTTASATSVGVPSQQPTQAGTAVRSTHQKTVQTTSATSQAPAPPAPPAPAPTTPAAVAAPPAAAAPASCHPLTNAGNCYEPGEYCRDADHDASGVAGDGKAITCEDNDGWRWEPA
jgi:hypothetical protein